MSNSVLLVKLNQQSASRIFPKEQRTTSRAMLMLELLGEGVNMPRTGNIVPITKKPLRELKLQRIVPDNRGYLNTDLGNA